MTMRNPRICTVDGCDKPRYRSKSMCAMHISRRKRGTAMDAPPRIVGNDDNRFWAKVDERPAEECWPWTGAKTGVGYGAFNMRGTVIGAHRYAFETLRGEIPDGLDLDHLCRNTVCVNPWHLEPVTRSENVRRGNSAREATS